MLVIKNIEKLKKKTIGAWKVTGVETNYQRSSSFSEHNYTIILGRNGELGAAIIIERIAGQYGYNVSVCYEEYDNVIVISPWPKDRLLDKDNFLVSIQGIIDTEYNKTN
jgi:hypothetical protein